MEKDHPDIGTPDLFVAATAEQLGADLATSNIRHFPMFRSRRCRELQRIRLPD
jgi:predicted nucleic acid-binding protein